MGDGHQSPQAAEAADVDHAAHRVHDAAGAEEQQGLEEGVRDKVEHAGRHARPAYTSPRATNM